MPDSTPYRTIAVASTFSPRFVEVLAEAKRIGGRFASDLSLIYVGEKNDETAAKFRAALEQLALPAQSNIHYAQGDPADAILRALREHKIDMIVAGALEKPLVLHPFLGNVADLLVGPGPPLIDGELPNNIAWLTDVIPCNLWLIR